MAATGNPVTGNPVTGSPLASETATADPPATSHQVVAIGSEVDVAGLALAGVQVLPAATAAGARQAWAELPAAQVAVVLLTTQAAADLGDARWSPGSPLSVVLPAGGPTDPAAEPAADDLPRADEESAGG